MAAGPEPFLPLEGKPLGFVNIVDGPFDLFEKPVAGNNLTGTVSGTTTTAGTVVGREGATGTVAGSTTTAGTVVGSAGSAQNLTGTITGNTTTSGTVVGREGATGSVSGTTTTAGTVVGREGATGIVTGSTTTTGTVTGSGGDVTVTEEPTGGHAYPRPRRYTAPAPGPIPSRLPEHKAGAVSGITRTRGYCRGHGAPNDDEAALLILELV